MAGDDFGIFLPMQAFVPDTQYASMYFKIYLKEVDWIKRAEVESENSEHGDNSGSSLTSNSART